jgi:rhodanese-related sulfurtransferase
VNGHITASALAAQIESGSAPAILDVRSRAEFSHGHVPGAVHVPFWQLSRRVDRIPSSPDATLVVYCGHGPRALLAGALLRRRGFRDVVYLAGHFSQWRSAGFREERS